MRIFCASLLAIFLLLLVGCDGETRHDVVTGEDGTLFGMSIYPDPQSLNVDTSDDFYLEWEPGYYPPNEFTFTLEQVNDDGSVRYVLTELTQLSIRRYRFTPVNLPPRAFLLLTVHGAGESVKAMYLTKNTLLLAPPRAVPADAKPEHVVTPRE